MYLSIGNAFTLKSKPSEFFLCRPVRLIAISFVKNQLRIVFAHTDESPVGGK